MYYLKRVITCAEGGECKEVGFADNACSDDATLWITDSSVMGRKLLAEGKAVLIWLHEGNRNQDFSAFRYACDNPADLDMDYLEGVYRRYIGIPWEILTTERCVVRETTVADVEDFYRIYEDPSISRYMEDLYEDPEEERAYARDYIDKVYSFYGFGIWTVLKKNARDSEMASNERPWRDEVIGRAGLCYREGYEDPELGFMIGADYQGKGLATEVCSAILRYGHEELGFERILAFVQPENLASARVCDKISMKREKQVEIKGHVYDIWSHEHRVNQNE